MKKDKIIKKEKPEKKVRLGGRPPKYATEEELAKKINKYLNTVDPSSYTISGLCVHLGIVRDTLSAWGKKDHRFSAIVNLAKMHIIASYESLLKGRAAAGAMFALANLDRTHWRKESNVDIKSDGKPVAQSVFMMPEAKEIGE